MLDAGIGIGWYCPSILPHPEREEIERTLIHNNRSVSGRDYDALQAELDALKAERGQPVPLSEWEQMVAERDALKSALQLAKPAIEDGTKALTDLANRCEHAALYAESNARTEYVHEISKCKFSAEQLRALAEIVK